MRAGSVDLEPRAKRYPFQGTRMTISALSFCLGGSPSGWRGKLRKHPSVLAVLLNWPQAERYRDQQPGHLD